MSTREPKAYGRKISKSIAKEYGLDARFKADVEAAIERVEREASLPDVRDLELADLREKVKRLEATIDKQADIQERSLQEIDRLEAENSRLEEQFLAMGDSLEATQKRLRGFESIARQVVSDTESAA